MATNTLGSQFLSELESEITSSRKCLERIPENLYNWKPHETSLNMGYLALLVAEIPKWITLTIQQSEIDLSKYDMFKLTTNAALLDHYDNIIKDAKKALQKVSDEDLTKPFHLKKQGQVVFSTSKKENVILSINHMVHHRGQLTVYMRMNNIPVPSIYGPSADDRVF